MNLIASPTVNIFSASLSDISEPNSSSKAITNSTVSKLSAPRSSIKLDSSVTFASSIPKWSATIFLTLLETSSDILILWLYFLSINYYMALSSHIHPPVDMYGFACDIRGQLGRQKNYCI